jgi:hypothetical protein
VEQDMGGRPCPPLSEHRWEAHSTLK